MKNYKYFLFDLDRTLWDFDKNAKTALFKLVDSQRLGELFGVTDKEEFFQKYEVINQNLWRQYERGEVQKEELRCNRFLFTLQQILDDAPAGSLPAHRYSPGIDYDFNKSLTISEEDRVKLNASFVDSICSSEVHFFDENQRCTACGYELSGIPQNKDVSNHIDKIIDLTENGEIGTDDALECFFNDVSYSYYFPSIKSQYITVYYKDGTEQNVKDALAEGKIKISDLDLFGISYYKTPNE